MVLFFFLPKNIPQLYHICFTKDCLKLTIWSHYEGSGTWRTWFHSCRSAFEVGNLFHTYSGLLAACGLPIGGEVERWVLPCQCSQTLSIKLWNVSPTTTISDFDVKTRLSSEVGQDHCRFHSLDGRSECGRKEVSIIF